MLSKTSLAVFAGMAVTASLLVAPAVVAGPMPGRAVAWGFNNDGQLGDNSLTKSLVPVVVDMSGALAGKAVTAIDAGVAHMCAVADGKAYCWGSNFIGRLGNNSLTDSAVPVAVDTTGPLAGKTVTAISAGYLHTCAVADGRAYCWGDGEYGQLGDGTPPGYSLVPVAVNTTGVFAPGVLAGKTVTVITAGYLHTCAVADGRAYCWGGGEHGRLGNNSLTDSYVPVAVSTAGPLAGKTVTAISAGFSHTCAVADGKAYCWGWNTYGQLGNNSITDSPVPVAVSTVGPLAGKTVTAIDAGSWHTCAVADGKAYCWGDNFSGQFGDTTTTGSAVPVAVDTSGVLAHKTVTAIAAGGNHTCAVADGKAYCWGFNSGSLGNNSLTNSPVPVAVSTAGPLAGKTVTAITAGAELSAAVLGAAVPQPPTAVAGKPGKAKVTVSWAAPGDDGGLPVMEYVATATPGGASCTTSSTSCVVGGLTNGTGYRFTVTARNAIGMSLPSAPSATVKPTIYILGKVTGFDAVVKKRKVKITWKAVPAATSYRVRISKPGGKKYKAWKTTSKRVFKAKVRKGKKYRVQVAAIAAGGRGPVTTIRFKGK